MKEIKQGDKVEVNGKVATVESWWAQGRHRVYSLSDGRHIFDLDKAVEAGTAKIIVDDSSFKENQIWQEDQEIDEDLCC
jgi:hypothetical protein